MQSPRMGIARNNFNLNCSKLEANETFQLFCLDTKFLEPIFCNWPLITAVFKQLSFSQIQKYVHFYYFPLLLIWHLNNGVKNLTQHFPPLSLFSEFSNYFSSNKEYLKFNS